MKGQGAMQKISVGVVGLRRGMSFAQGMGDAVAMELVALCDMREKALREASARFSRQGKQIATYTDYEKFLEHDMEAVILANYFHQHAPFAVKALRAGKHVMSETSACFTLAEGVELVEQVENSGKIYMFAENCPYMVFNQEMRRLYQAGKIGRFTYGEGEYVHPMDAESLNRLAPGVHHWRNWIPATYYCTHALAPVMFITDTRPVRVSGFVMPHSPDDPVTELTVRRNDAASLIVLRMDNGALVKLLQVHLRGHGWWVRIHGSRGLVENLRCGDSRMVRLRREPFDKEEGEPVERIYLPDFPEHHREAQEAGHLGGDFFLTYHFANAIRKGEQPYLDVYRGVAMSLAGILAYRSALEDSKALEVPDFRNEEARARYASDRWNPDPSRRKQGDPWPSVLGEVKPTEKGLASAREVWERYGLDEAPP